MSIVVKEIQWHVVNCEPNESSTIFREKTKKKTERQHKKCSRKKDWRCEKKKEKNNKGKE